jgi:hypothetical protein
VNLGGGGVRARGVWLRLERSWIGVLSGRKLTALLLAYLPDVMNLFRYVTSRTLTP